MLHILAIGVPKPLDPNANLVDIVKTFVQQHGSMVITGLVIFVVGGFLLRWAIRIGRRVVIPFLLVSGIPVSVYVAKLVSAINQVKSGLGK